MLIYWPIAKLIDRSQLRLALDQQLVSINLVNELLISDYYYYLAQAGMGRKITYVPLPIFSIATYKSFIYFSGGGGGKTGIPNEILIFERTVTANPIHRISTGTRLFQNMTVSLKYNVLACSANQNLLLFQIVNKGKDLRQLFQIEVDQTFKNPTINAICFHHSEPVLAVGGDDSVIRFFTVAQSDPPMLAWEHKEHREPIRKIDSKEGDLFVSNDAQVAIVVNSKKREILRKFYRDQLNPMGSVLQSAYFLNEKNSTDLKLILCHYIVRHESYVTRELNNSQYLTLQVSRDQSCATAKQGKYLGVACGQGATYIIDTEKMECIGKEKGHEFVITTGVLTKGHRFITGTSSCSYLIQERSGPSLTWLISLMVTVLLVFVLAYGQGDQPYEQL